MQVLRFEKHRGIGDLRSITVVLIALLGAVGLFPHPSNGQTEVEGTITQDSTWGQSGSPYLLVGDLDVEATLTIESGVEVQERGDRGFVDVEGDGRLEATGTTFRHVGGGDNLFIGARDQASISLQNVVLDSTTVEHTGSGAHVLANSTVKANGHVEVGEASSASITGNQFNGALPLDLIDSGPGTLTISGNSFPEGSAVGLYGEVTSDRTMPNYQERGRYLLLGDLDVEATLTIESGVEVQERGDRGFVDVEGDGRLEATGTAFRHVGGGDNLFIGARDQASISLQNVVLDSTTVEHTGSGAHVLANSTVKANGHVEVGEASSASITGNQFNGALPLDLIDSGPGTLTISGNSFPEGSAVGLYGEVTSDRTMPNYQERGRYLLLGDLDVEATLTIESGVEVQERGDRGFVDVEGDGRLEATGTTFRHVGGGDNLFIGARDQASISLQNVVLDSTTVEHTGSGAHVLANSTVKANGHVEVGEASSASITGNQFNGALPLDLIDSGPGTLTISGNSFPEGSAVGLYGEVTSDRTMPNYQERGRYLLLGDLDVEATLTIESGVEVQERGDRGFVDVEGDGRLEATGTAFRHVGGGGNLFIGARDQASISLQNVVLDSTTVEHTGSGAHVLANSTVKANGHVEVGEASSASITGNQFNGALPLDLIDSGPGTLTISGNSFPEGSAVGLYGEVTSDRTMPNYQERGRYLLLGNLDVEATLTIESGVEVQERGDRGFVRVEEDGRLEATGTTFRHVGGGDNLFIGVRDQASISLQNVVLDSTTVEHTGSGAHVLANSTVKANGHVEVGEASSASITGNQFNGALPLDLIDSGPGTLTISGNSFPEGSAVGLYGEVTSDRTMPNYQERGRYLLLGNLDVEATLTIESGVEVQERGDRGFVRVEEDGRLEATGTTFRHVGGGDNLFIGARDQASISLQNVVLDSTTVAYSGNTSGSIDSSNVSVSSLLTNDGSNQIDAENNWWGDESGPFHDSKNPDGEGAEVSGNVDFEPWAEEPFDSLPLEELAAPTDLTANPGDGQVDLNWTPGGDSNPAGYKVYRSTSSFSDISNATKLNESLVDGTNFTDTEVTNGTEYFYRVTAVDGEGNESSLSGEVSAIPSAGGDQTLAVGGLTIYADQIQNTSGSTYEVSGNVSVDQALFLEGTVTVDTEALSIEGNGEIFLSGVPDKGIVTLYDGPYGFTLPSESSTVLAGDGLDAANTLFSVAGLGVQIGGLEVLDDGVRVEGQLQLPKLLGTIKPEISSLQITESNGLDFTGSIEVEEVELKDGVAELEELSLEYASAENRFTGSASLVTPPFGLMAGTQIIGGRLDSVGVDIAVSPPVPIANTGLGLAGGGGFVSGLVKPPTALGINADITPLTGNTEVVTLADLSLKYRFDTLIKGGGRVEIFEQGVGGASLTVSARKAAFEGRLGLSVPTANANVLEGNLSAGVSRAAAPDVDLLASGGLSATLQIPDIGDGFPYGWISSLAGLPYRVANTENTLRAQPLNAAGQFKGEATVGGGIPGVSGYGIAYGVAYDQGDLSASFADNMENLNEELFPLPALALKSAAREANRFEGQSLTVGTGQPNRLLKSQADTLRQSFTLQRETPSLIIRVQRDAGMPGYTITSPSGRIVSAEGAGSVSNINYSEAPDQNKAFYSIKNPQAGEWSINVPDDGTEHAIDVIGATPAPTLDLDPPEASGQTVSLNWQLTALEGEATVDLYYDRDRSGRDGVQIAEGLSEDQTSFSWDTSSLPTGTYYVYAVARDGKNAPQAVYAEKPIEVTKSGAPMPPEGVSASAQDTALVVGWNERDAASRYTVYYAEGEDPSFQSRRVGVGDTTEVALDRIPSGRTYHVAVTASDTSGRESRLSGAAAATFESQSENNAPQITTSDPKTIARKGETYSQQISATDADGDALSYALTRSPDGMSIGNGGQISWSPAPGTYRVGVRVTDGQGGADSLDYQLTALDRQGAVARVSFSQPTYFGSQAGQLVVEDPALNASPSAIDSQQVQVRSDANPQGTEIVLRETSANSGRLQGSFGLGEESSESPAVPVEPVDSLRVTYQDSDPDTSVAVFARFYEQEPPRDAPVLLAPRAGGVASTQPTLNWEGVDAAETYRVQVARDSTFQTLALEETTSNPGLMVGSLEAETAYYWRVRAESVVDGPWSVPSAFVTRAQRVLAAVERSFGEASGPGDYRLVGLPGEASRPLGASVPGEAGTGWQAFWDDGSTENYFQKYDGSGTFTFSAGRGFWLTSQQSWTVEDSISAVPLKNGSTASIPVREGWNIVSNPLGRDVAWSAVAEANGGSLQPLWAFDGSFAEADTFRSARAGEAFYFLNDTGLDSLKVPYPTGSAAKSQATGKSQEEKSLVTIRARPKNGNGPTSSVKVGFDKEAAEGLGRLDEPAPPGRFSELSLRLQAPGEAPPRRRSLMTERRPPADGPEEGHTFDLRLQARGGGPAQITADGLSAIGSEKAKLLRPSTGRSYDLAEGTPVAIEEVDSTAALQLAIGSASYVEEQARQIVPDEVSLTSYPNPTRGQATIEYTLPEAGEVTLEVYDVLGRRVATLEQGRKEAGRHTARLETGRLSSGVYFGRLEAGGETRTQKITVVR